MKEFQPEQTEEVVVADKQKKKRKRKEKVTQKSVNG
jgi:hypothetical protein